MTLPRRIATYFPAYCVVACAALAQTRSPNAPAPLPQRDAVQDAQTTQPAKADRPEQQKTEHDNSPVFMPSNAKPLSPALKSQPKEGKISGFDFYRDPLNADRPQQSPDEIMQKEIANKPNVMNAQRQLLESRYDLTPHPDPQVKMSRGKPIPVGPTAKLKQGMTFEQLASTSPDQIKTQNAFPYPSLPHPLHTNGGQVFPQIQINMFPRLQRFDVDFDIPDAF